MSPIPYPEPPLSSSTFVLRPFREDDFRAALTLSEDPATARWVEPLPADDGAGVVSFFEESRAAGELLHLVIADRATDGYLGEVMLAPDEYNVAEIGCCLVPAARGRGIATETLVLLTDWALEALRLERVQVVVARENTQALRLVDRAGFCRDEGHGEDVDLVVLSRPGGYEPG